MAGLPAVALRTSNAVISWKPTRILRMRSSLLNAGTASPITWVSIAPPRPLLREPRPRTFGLRERAPQTHATLAVARLCIRLLRLGLAAAPARRLLIGRCPLVPPPTTHATLGRLHCVCALCTVDWLSFTGAASSTVCALRRHLEAWPLPGAAAKVL